MPCKASVSLADKIIYIYYERNSAVAHYGTARQTLRLDIVLAEVLDTITLPEGGNYIGIECENFTGSIELNME